MDEILSVSPWRAPISVIASGVILPDDDAQCVLSTLAYFFNNPNNALMLSFLFKPSTISFDDLGRLLRMCFTITKPSQ
jgi:hypothetical protein